MCAALPLSHSSGGRAPSPVVCRREDGTGEAPILQWKTTALFFFVAFLTASAHAQSIVTFAGGGTDDGKLATEVALFNVRGVTLDAAGNIYITEQSANLVRRIGTDGRISTLAGNGGSGFSGDGGPAKNSTLNQPYGIVLDRNNGDIYVADSVNGRIRKISGANGTISTFAGIGKERDDGKLGDDGPASEAVLRAPIGVTLAGGALYITEWGYLGHRVRKVVLSTGKISTIAGSTDGTDGFGGDGDLATKAVLNQPTGVVVDSAGNVFFSDSGNQRVREIVAATGNIITYAGSGHPADGIGDGGQATAAQLDFPLGLALDANGNLLVMADNGLRKVDKTTHVISTIGRDLGRAYGIAVESSGNVLVTAADGYGELLRVQPGNPDFAAVAGGGSYVGDGLLAGAAVLRSPQGVTTDAAGNLFIADASNLLVRRVDAKTGIISTFAGNHNYYDEPSDNGKPATTVPVVPVDVAVDSNGDLYIADAGNYRIKKVDAKTGVLTFYAGGGDPPNGNNDGLPATDAKFLRPVALTFDRANNLYVADADANRVYVVDAATKKITTLAGNGKEEFFGDGGPAKDAGLAQPTGVAVDANGIVYIVDSNNVRVRKVAADKTISTFAGTGDDTQLSPKRVAIDRRNGTLFVTDAYSSRVKRVDAGGVLTTVAGSGTAYFIDAGFSGDNGAATAAKLNFPFDLGGLAIDASGNIFIGDSSNNRVRAVFACVSVSAPILSAPADNATNTTTAPLLTWSTVPGASRYDVLLDTANPPVRVAASDVSQTSFTPANLIPGTKYFWSIAAKGDPFCPSTSRSTSAVRAFTTSSACAAVAFTLSAPQDGATNVTSPVTLSWNASQGALTYDLYLGPTNPPPLAKSDLTSTSFNANVGSGQYFWFVVAHASCDSAKTFATPVRSFTTAAQCQPGQIQVATTSPSNGATNIASNVDLTWTSSGGATSFDLYFGTTQSPPLLATGLTSTTQNVASLQSSTQYFWRVVAKGPCDPNGVSSQTASFTTLTCAEPGPTSITFAPATVSAGSTYSIVWSPARGLDTGGGYVVERSTSPDFGAVLDSQVTSSTAASFLAGDPGTLYHRVHAVPGCDPTKPGRTSDVVPLTVVAAKPNVVFSTQPQAAIESVNGKLEELGGTFTLENISSQSLQVIVGRQELNGSPPFFSIADPQGQDVAFVTLPPHTPKTFAIRYSGPSTANADSYQGVIFVASTGAGLAITPYAFVNLKVGGGTSATPQFTIDGVPADYISFPGLSGDDASRSPLQVGIRSPGNAPIDVGFDIGPEVWLSTDRSSNATRIEPNSTRIVNLSTRRSRAPNGSALPRYTYLTARTKDGATARLLVQDNDDLALASRRTIRLDVGVRSFIVPEATSRMTPRGLLATRLRLSNIGSDAVQVELIFTPSQADGFDSDNVKRVTVVAPPNDVITLTDPLAQVFRLARPASGQIEVRLPRERIGLVTVSAETFASNASMSIPVVNRGDGARVNAAHVLLGVTNSGSTTTSLVLAETSGNDHAVVRATLFDATSARVTELTGDIPRYGYARFDTVGANVTNGRFDIHVDSGGGSVIALGIVGSSNSDAAATAISRPATDTSNATALARLLRRAVNEDSPSVSLVTVVPVLTTPTSPGPKPAFHTILGFVAPPSGDASFDATLQGTLVTAKTTVTVPAGTTKIYNDVLAELFAAAPNSQAGVFVKAAPTAKIFAMLQPSSSSPSSFLPLLTTLSESLTSASGLSQRPLFADGLEQSIDPTRGSRWLLTLNEVGGGNGVINVKLYEPANRSLPIGDKDFNLSAYQQLQLDTVFAALGLDDDAHKKDRTNVQCVVTARSGTAKIAATAVRIDNVSGDAKVIALQPSVGSAAPSDSLVTPVPTSAPPPGKRHAAKH